MPSKIWQTLEDALNLCKKRVQRSFRILDTLHYTCMKFPKDNRIMLIRIWIASRLQALEPSAVPVIGSIVPFLNGGDIVLECLKATFLSLYMRPPRLWVMDNICSSNVNAFCLIYRGVFTLTQFFSNIFHFYHQTRRCHYLISLSKTSKCLSIPNLSR